MVDLQHQIWQILQCVEDPEIPYLNVVEMGIVREVKVNNGIEVVITPTYSGCPAMKTIEEDIQEALAENGFHEAIVKTVLSPAWTTDWMTDDALSKLRMNGIAPPERGASDKGLLMGKIREIACPRCFSKETTMISQFGSTACKALYKCQECLEPFDHFKCI
jgi:ring-1,2-phenylacetyl-CoA epoxidase subunit PaaD